MVVAEIISTGDEIVRGLRVNTNASYLARELSRLGILPVRHAAVSDAQDAIEEALKAAAGADVILVTGGLGPTEDDRTRYALAAVLGEKLVENAEALAALEKTLSERGRKMSPTQHRQALLPASAEWLPNSVGTAPGIHCRLGRAEVFCLPGPPDELEPMFARYVLPRLEPLGGGNILVSRALHAIGEAEAVIGERIADLMAPQHIPAVALTVHGSIISIHIHAAASSGAEVQRMLDATEAEVRGRLGDLIFGSGDETLQGAVARLLEGTGRTLAVAESCTGGLIGASLVDVPGISKFFLEGLVSYSNRSKVERLGIDEKLIAEHGAVSGEVVRAMAAGMRERSGADLALAVTGIAGPTGGTAEKPVGLVWFAIADDVGVEAWQYRFGGPRDLIRMRATRTALNLLRLHLMKG